MSDRDLTTKRSQVFGDVRKGTECRVCGRNVTDGRSKNCSEYCRNIVEAVMQLLNWDSVRRRILKRDDQVCQECGFDFKWYEKGRRHIRQRIKEEIGEPPKSPSILAIGNGDVSDEELRQHREQWSEWAQKRDELQEQYNYIAGTPDRHPDHPEVDHITPVSRGGHPFDPRNLITLCNECHKKKTAKDGSLTSKPNQMERPETDLTEFILSGGEV